MRRTALFLACLLACTSSFAATDPFVGTWIYNAQKSQKPTIKYSVKDLGGDRYALTGSTGVTVEIKADGIPIQTPTGATVSFRKLDERDWEMARDDGQKMVRTYNISPDDKTLTLHDVFSGNDADNYETTAKYARLSPGKGIFGDWQSVSLEEKMTGEALKLIIVPFESDGLSFSIPTRKHLMKMKFDGKMYRNSGTGDEKNEWSSGKRVNDRVAEIEDRDNGKLNDTAELRVSDDNKTLMVVTRPANSSVVFTEVWDRQ